MCLFFSSLIQTQRELIDLRALVSHPLIEKKIEGLHIHQIALIKLWLYLLLDKAQIVHKIHNVLFYMFIVGSVDSVMLEKLISYYYFINYLQEFICVFDFTFLYLYLILLEFDLLASSIMNFYFSHWYVLLRVKNSFVIVVSISYCCCSSLIIAG